MVPSIHLVIERDRDAFEHWCDARHVSPYAPGIVFIHATDIEDNLRRLHLLGDAPTYAVVVEPPSADVREQLAAHGITVP